MKNIKITFFMLLMIFIFYTPKVMADNSAPEIVGQAALTVDVSTGELIYTKNIDKRMYPASTTKLLTAMLLAENKSPGDLLTYSKAAQSQEPYTFNFNIHSLNPGDKITASDAMDAMLLCSANDMAYMIGENVGGGDIKKFIDMMNQKAKELQLKNTHFVTPNGLPDPNHYTTAYDLSVIAREDYKYPWIMNTLSKKSSILKSTEGVVATLPNKNKLLSDDGCVGGKTGYTSEAGRCLVEYYDRNGRKIVGIVLDSDYDKKDTTVFQDMQKIIDWSYSAEKQTMISKDSPLKTLSVNYKPLPLGLGGSKDLTLSVHTNQDFSRYVNSEEFTAKYTIEPFSVWKLDKNIPIGSVTITGRELTKTLPLYPSISSKDVINLNSSLYNTIIISCISTLVLIILLIIFIIRRKKSYFRRNKVRRKIF